MKRSMILINFICAITVLTYSQTSIKKNSPSSYQIKELLIGGKIPASVWNKIPKKKTTELLILDFWATGCTSCMEAFPHMEELQSEFPEKLQVVLVNPWEDEAKVKERMNQINVRRLKSDLKPYAVPAFLPSITGDTIFKQLFPAQSIPHHVWLDANGKVLYITHGYNATKNHVRQILAGESVSMSLKRDLTMEGFSAWDGILRKGHQSVKPAFYSCFIRYNSGFGGGSSNLKDSAAGTILRVYVNNYITGLFQEAFGYTPRVLLEVSDKQDYKYPRWLKDGDIMDEWNEKNLFTYEICVPFREEKNINKYMQTDLNRFFGIEKGIEGLIEKRKLNCIILVGKGNNILKTYGGKSFDINNDSLVKLVNHPYSIVTNMLRENLEDMDTGQPFLDDTEIDPDLKVDMQLTGDLKNMENVRSQLHKYGLDIIKESREVDVLVIRYKNN